MSDLTWNSGAGLLAGWLLTYAVHSTLLLGLAWLLTRQRPFSAYHRADILWKAALIGGLITATAQTALSIAPLTGQIRLPWPDAVSVKAVPAALPAGNVPAVRQAVVLLHHGDNLPVGWPVWVLGVWLVGASLSIAGWLIRRWRLQMFLQRSKRRSLAGSSLAFLLRRLCRTAGIPYRVRLTSSYRILSPIALEDHEICVPARAITDLSVEQQESMLAHELAHIARRDAAWRQVGEFMQAVFFFQPLNFVARRHLQEIAEYLCDDWAVEHTGGHLSLARCLAEVATWLEQQAQPIGAASLTGKPSLLVSRVTRLVGRPDRPPSAFSMFWGKLAALAVLLAVIGLAPLISVPVPLSERIPFDGQIPRLFYVREENGVWIFTSGNLVPPPPPDIPAPLSVTDP